MFQGIQGPPAEGMVLDKGVGRDPPAPHGLPQRVIYDQKTTSLVVFIIFPGLVLEYTRYIGYNRRRDLQLHVS